MEPDLHLSRAKKSLCIHFSEKQAGELWNDSEYSNPRGHGKSKILFQTAYLKQFCQECLVMPLSFMQQLVIKKSRWPWPAAGGDTPNIDLNIVKSSQPLTSWLDC